MAFKMKGFSYPGKPPLKQYGGGKFDKAIKASEEAGDITKDPTTEGTLNLAGQTTTTDKDGNQVTTQGSQDIYKRGQHDADRAANFGSSVTKLAGLVAGKKQELIDAGGTVPDKGGQKSTAANTSTDTQNAVKNAAVSAVQGKDDQEGLPEELKGKTPDTGLLAGLENYGKNNKSADAGDSDAKAELTGEGVKKAGELISGLFNHA